jgi:hypothetical protein
LLRYTLYSDWWILEAGFDNIVKCLLTNFGSFVLRERQNHKIRVEITSYVNQIASDQPSHAASTSTSAADNEHLGPKRKLCDIFRVIEDNKMALNIQEYSVAQTSLEQIFNQFAAKVCTCLLWTFSVLSVVDIENVDI